MAKQILTLLSVLLLTASLQAQQDDPYDQRGVQFAAQGTDFWVCFPRTRAGFSYNASRLYVVSERDCDVTVTCPLLDYSQTVHIMRREMCGPDTNYINIPYEISHFIDTIAYTYPIEYDRSYVGQTGDRPQPRGFHVTSTDTVSLFLWVRSMGSSAATNVLPTEMLRDEYVVQTPKAFRELIDYNDTAITTPINMSPSCASIDIVAVEDSTVVDIVLSDWDWTNRHPGDTVTVTLSRGEMFQLGVGEVREKYYPLFEPYYRYYIFWNDCVSPLARPVKMRRHAFDASYITVDTFTVDLTGTRIKARDCKRIAVFEGGGSVLFPHSGVPTMDLMIEQSLPTKYVGKEFLVPNVYNSDTDYIRITGLHDSTMITIHDGSRSFNNIRTLTVDAYETEWFALMPGEGPFYVSSTHPVMMKEYLMYGMPRILDMYGGDPGFFAVKPVEWWHNGQVNFGTITDVDANNNRQTRHASLYIFTRTVDAPSIMVDSYCIENHFTPIPGTPYSHARFDSNSQYVSEGSHYIKSTTGAKFMAVMASAAAEEQAVVNLPHSQPGKTCLTVNGIPADSLGEDSIWCMYDPVTFRSWDERPADSVLWDFGDGTTRAYSHLEEGFDSPQVHTYQDTGKYRVMCVFTYEYDSCFTLKPDTLWAPIWIHNHYDSSFSVHLCEGTYTFRNHLLEYTDTYYITTYWTPSGCDTLFTIDFSTCPHCSWDYDTVSPLDMPWQYNGYTFGSEVHDEPVHIPIGDDCDSVIYYTLIVIPHWGEPPLDSVFILAPNVITPNRPGNNRFSLYCSHHILQAEVTVFNRRGTKVAQFDGLTGSWDGTSQGRTCHQGAYVYYIRYIDTHDTNWKTLKGTVTLIY